jgi:flagellin
MSSDVVLSAALRSNLLSLQSTQRLIDSTQLRLATGLKVSSALDNPQNFFTSQALNNRASDLTRLLDGIGQSIRTIEEADAGITALTSLVSQAQSVADQADAAIRASEGFASIRSTADLDGVGALVAASGGTLVAGDDFKITVRNPTTGVVTTSVDINIDATDNIYNLAAEINASAVGTGNLVRADVEDGRLVINSLVDGNIIRVLDGTTTPGADGFAFLGLNSVVNSEGSGVGTFRQAGTVIAGNVVRSQAALVATAVNGVYQSSATLNAAGYVANYGTAATDDVTLSLDIDGVVTTIGSYTNTSTIQEVIDDINTAGISADVSASFNTTTGQIEVTFAEDVGVATIRFGHNDGTSTGDIAFGFATGVLGFGALGGATDVTLAAGATQLQGERIIFTGSSTSLTQFTDDFNNIRSQIDDLVSDAQYRGVNLLGGDNLTTFFNEDRSSSLVTEGEDFSAAGLGLSQANFITAANVQTAISQARGALEAVRNFGSTLANDLSIIQTRRDFTESTIATLKAGADDLTVADQNEEGANLLALQTRQQLGVTSLSLAAQSQQSVLRLF